MPELFRCIYCVKDLERSAFNREHVMPESFGLFGPSTLVLHETVCTECNSYFGRRLEMFLGRDSLEGFLRYRFGTGQRSESFKQRRIVFALAEEGEWQGTLLAVTGFMPDGKMVVDFVPQVAFYKKAGKEKTHFLADRIPPAKELEAQGYDCSRAAIFGPDDASRRDIAKTLAALSYTMNKWQDGPKLYLENGPNYNVPIEVTGQIDHTIKRAVAKIALNYTAHVHGRDFALGPDFDGARAYVRHGTPPPWDIVSMDSRPILQNDANAHQHAPRHLVTLNWDAAHKGIFAEISLFNAFRYVVRLCDRFTGIFREVRSGHAFDLESRAVTPLIGLDKRIAIVKTGGLLK